jgi:RIO kinase 1
VAKVDIYRIIEKDIEIPKKFERRRKDANNIKTYDEVFDRSTLMNIYKLITDKVISSVDFPISSGKEANIFRGTTPEGDYVVLKIYRMATATFKSFIKYIDGDERFKNIKRDHRNIIYTWAKKEFRNLQRMVDAGSIVPKPIKYRKNILVMEYIGEGDQPAPELRLVRITRPANKFKIIIEQMKTIYSEAGLVHGDISEYNILMRDDEPVIIDVGQAVMHNHPRANELLVHDINNITNYFKRTYSIKIDQQKITSDFFALQEES